MAITTTNYQTVTVAPGQIVYIPKNATVIGLTSTGDSGADSSCLDLESLEDFTCYVISWALSADDTPSVALEHQDTFIESLTVAGVTYTPGAPISADVPDVGTTDDLLAFLNANGLTGVMQNAHFNQDPAVGDRYPKFLYFETIPSIAATILLELSSSNFASNLFLKPSESENCDEAIVES